MIDYRRRLIPVLRALEQDPDLSIEALADRACLSLYHFHRVFTAVAGEAPGEMCRRLRMQRAAWQLCYTDASVTTIALGAGLASSQAFAKAFRRHYGCTPGAFRRDKSKNGHLLSKDGHASDWLLTYAEDHSSARSNTMKTIEMDARTLAYIRVTGPYGEGYDPVCGQLHQWASARGLAQGEWIFIYHDNPEVTPPAQCRRVRSGQGRSRSSLFPPVATPSPAISSRTAVSTGRVGRSMSAISSPPGWRSVTGPVSSYTTA